jgi:hypothetical protein
MISSYRISKEHDGMGLILGLLQLSHARSISSLNISLKHVLVLIYVLPGPPKSANLRTMLGPISSYSALVWQ